MDPEASQAAVSAIAALQQRVRELEEQAALLDDEHESLRIRLDNRDIAFRRREAALNEAMAKAKEIMNSTSAAMAQLSDARAQRQAHRSLVDDLEHQLQTVQGKIKSAKSQQRRAKSGLGDLLRKLAEYEILIGDVVAHRPHRPCLTPDETALISSGIPDPDLLPPSLAPILSALQSLPKNFPELTLGKKRKAVRALSNASAAVTELNAKVRALECEKFASSTPKKFEAEMKRLSVQMFILSREIGKFEFA
jgi:DNA repair exonuclease SbcCD ATPase subunit